MIGLTRRDFVALVAASLVTSRAAGETNHFPVITRPIPHSGERLPAVGLGTASVFDRDADDTRRAAADVVRTLIDGGARLVDTASTYGDAERVLGKVMTAESARDRLFIATKLEEPDEAELERSLTRLGTRKVDLLQLHNVRDPRQSLARFFAWKRQGLCRYVGITSTYHSDFDALLAVLGREKPDFVQIDYSIDNRVAEARILPLAADVGAAVLTALPFGRGRLFRAVRDKSIPDWARPLAGSWAVFFLKYLLADERVTAVIPGTARAAHMADNLGAMHGTLPDAEQRKRMVSFIATL
jgi:aryl-alcohol dehydrogenase-like predicted oxidoreductase